MAVIVQVVVTDDTTGEVTKGFVQTFNGDRYDFFDWVRRLMARVAIAAFGSDEDWA